MNEEQSQQPAQESQATTNKSKPVLKGLAVMIAIIVAAAGAYYYTNQQAVKDKAALSSQIDDLKSQVSTLQASAKAEMATPATVAPATKSDTELITAVLAGECNVMVNTVPSKNKITVKSVSNGFAQATYLCGGHQEGPEVILKKTNDTWTVVWTGLGNPDSTDYTQFGIPKTLPKY